VRIGQRVEQGQVVGYAGTTGYSTGVHLHFEIMRGGVPINPLGMLPP
jgi:murein DD-endopeptidase MepM/ murein hydrolase activator NlpD